MKLLLSFVSCSHAANPMCVAVKGQSARHMLFTGVLHSECSCWHPVLGQFGIAIRQRLLKGGVKAGDFGSDKAKLPKAKPPTEPGTFCPAQRLCCRDSLPASGLQGGFFIQLPPLRDQHPPCHQSLEKDEGWAEAEGAQSRWQSPGMLQRWAEKWASLGDINKPCLIRSYSWIMERLKRSHADRRGITALPCSAAWAQGAFLCLPLPGFHCCTRNEPINIHHGSLWDVFHWETHRWG